MDQEMDLYEVNMTSVETDTKSETSRENATRNVLEVLDEENDVDVDETESPDSAKQEIEYVRSVRWPASTQLLEDGGGPWVGLASPFPTNPGLASPFPTIPSIEINPRILSPPPLSTDITAQPDLSTSEVLDLPTITSFETPTLDFPSDIFPPRLPVTASNQVTQLGEKSSKQKEQTLTSTIELGECMTSLTTC